MKLTSPLPSYVFYVAVGLIVLTGFAFIRVLKTVGDLQVESYNNQATANEVVLDRYSN